MKGRPRDQRKAQLIQSIRAATEDLILMLESIDAGKRPERFLVEQQAARIESDAKRLTKEFPKCFR